MPGRPTPGIQALLLQQGRWEGEVRHRRKDGALLWVSALWVANLDEQNRLLAVFFGLPEVNKV